MSIFTGFKAVALLLLYHEVCGARRADIPVSVPKNMCEPCLGQAFPDQQTGNCHNDRPDLFEMVNNVVGELNISLQNVQEHVLNERKRLQHMYDIPDNLTNLVNISGLSGIENSAQFKRRLDKRLKPRKILQVIYIRTLLFSAYTDALKEIYVQNNRLSDSLDIITLELRRIACTTVGFFVDLRFKQIKPKLTKQLCSYKEQIDGIRSTDYETSILCHGNQLLQESIEDLNNLVNEIKSCHFRCKSGKKLKLKCKNKDKKDRRKLRNNTKLRKIKSGKDKRKNRNNKKNRNDRKNKRNRNTKGNKKSRNENKRRRTTDGERNRSD